MQRQLRSTSSYYTISLLSYFLYSDTATTEIYTLSLHDALPISSDARPSAPPIPAHRRRARSPHLLQEQQSLPVWEAFRRSRSEEHTSELQSPDHLVCRLLLEKKKPACYSSSSILEPDIIRRISR